jgi:hypothetical protein
MILSRCAAHGQEMATRRLGAISGRRTVMVFGLLLALVVTSCKPQSRADTTSSAVADQSPISELKSVAFYASSDQRGLLEVIRQGNDIRLRAFYGFEEDGRWIAESLAVPLRPVGAIQPIVLGAQDLVLSAKGPGGGLCGVLLKERDTEVEVQLTVDHEPNTCGMSFASFYVRASERPKWPPSRNRAAGESGQSLGPNHHLTSDNERARAYLDQLEAEHRRNQSSWTSVQRDSIRSEARRAVKDVFGIP